MSAEDWEAELGGERAPVTVVHYNDAHDGPGWYYIYDEYPDEGSCGAFSTREEAVKHARESDCEVSDDG